MAKQLAVTIAGAVSLGSYEAGVMFEVLDAIAQQNAWADQSKQPDLRIEIDVLTGASAGGMTSAIVGHSLLFAGSSLAQPYDNPLYNAWVRDIDLSVLLARQPGEDVTHSILSSNCIIGISHRYLTPTPPPTGLDPHPALPRNGPVQLGLSMSNLNGVDYFRPTMTGGSFIYTRFEDEYAQVLDPQAGYQPATWEAIRQAGVACGAFPFAFRVQDIVRNIADYLSSPCLLTALWGGQPSIVFTYTDGGLFQNEPLGLAKNFVDEQLNGHLNTQDRGYLFIAPKPKNSDAQGGFHAKDADYKATALAIALATLGQAEFQDWVTAESLNDRIAALNRLATELQVLFTSRILDPNATTAVTGPVLNLLFTANGEVNTTALGQARAQLSRQFAQEYSSWGGSGRSDRFPGGIGGRPC